MTENLTPTPEEQKLKYSLRAQKGWETRRANEVEDVKKLELEVRSKYQEVLSSLELRTRDYQHKLGIIRRYTRAKANKTIASYLEKAKELRDDQLKNIEKLRERKHELEALIDSYRKKVPIIFEKKQQSKKKAEQLESFLEFLKIFPEEQRKSLSLNL